MDSNSMERRVVSKIAWRLLPFMCLCYVTAFIDRANVGFAKLRMMSDLHLDTDMYAWGAGIFFVGYFFFEVPSNLILERVGARVWIARIMILWGIISAGMMFTTGKWSFYALRFLLGAGEAGFFPGMILYNTYWFPKAYRARTISIFMSAAVMSFVIGQPLSGYLMDHPQFGMKSWQWLFLMEGIPAVVLGVVVLFYLPNGPQKAKWLAPEELAWLTARLDSEKAAQEKKGHFTLKQALTHPRILFMSLIYFCNTVGGYGLDFFAPTILSQAFPQPKYTMSDVGWLAAIAPLIALPVMIVHGRLSDHFKERRWHGASAAWCCSIGLLLLSFKLPPWMVIVAMTLAVCGRWSLTAPFWGVSTSFLTGTAAAGGIAMINSLGNLGGQAGPKILGWFKTADTAASPSGSLSMGLRVIAGFALMCGILLLLTPKPPPEVPPADAKS